MAKAKTPTEPAKLIITDDPLIRCALNAIPSPASEIREGISCGEHEVDFKISLTGELRIGPDTMTKQVNKLKPWSLVKLLADQLPERVVSECMHAALAAMTEDTEVPGADDLKARTQDMLDHMSQLIVIPRKGSVRFHGVVREI